MITFNNVAALQRAPESVKDAIQQQGVLKVGGREYHIQSDLQQVLRTQPKDSIVARFIEGVSKLFTTGSSASVAQGLTRSLFTSHAGALQQRLQSISSVEHARMLFKDAGLQSPEQVLDRLGRTDDKSLNGVSSGEVKQLFERALAEALVNTASGQALEALVGPSVTRALVNKQLPFASLESLRTSGSSASVVGGLEPILMVELKNLGLAQQHQQSVLQQDLGSAPYNSVLSESFYNPKGYTEDVDRAAAWILKASTSGGNEWENFTALLREYRSNGKDLTDATVLKELHQRLVPDIDRSYRGPAISGGRLLSSITGAAMLDQHLKTLDKDHEQVGKQLFAAVVGFHGFIDGNGRMGRLLYALTELRAQQFTPMAVETENLLSGLS
ncbi:VopS family T3SS effector adenosine monophosphate-protein transferase [Pseudomonas sp. O64]|uniref:VopS family T3SS effector adenosine monophosphate-protein transferase n=1 Tax=unclassified Pseudomonas TaxID=196821 RepID=UPI0021D989AD|nr:VopS family T3SS effector adenosine monophosphate-protein transferase [Pseudomonas sp. YeP6b]UXZ22809.1 VopS family T3SS effector adenosine monophosphate-protein transferase [Pseudomonas sp. YeP6b]